jgi:hypothetical protein
MAEVVKLLTHAYTDFLVHGHIPPNDVIKLLISKVATRTVQQSSAASNQLWHGSTHAMHACRCWDTAFWCSRRWSSCHRCVQGDLQLHPSRTSMPQQQYSSADSLVQHITSTVQSSVHTACLKVWQP